jgi:hypothetical protein
MRQAISQTLQPCQSQNATVLQNATGRAWVTGGHEKAPGPLCRRWGLFGSAGSVGGRVRRDNLAGPSPLRPGRRALQVLGADRPIAAKALGGDAALAEELRRFYGLDLSIPAQLGNYLWRLIRFDLGFSAIYGKPVATVIFERLPATLALMTAALSFAFFVGLGLGVIAAKRVNGWPDTVISTLGLIFYATPSFWFGLMAIVFFSVHLQWLPPPADHGCHCNR